MGFRVQDLEFRVWGLGFRVWGVRFKVSGFPNLGVPLKGRRGCVGITWWYVGFRVPVRFWEVPAIGTVVEELGVYIGVLQPG